MWFFCGVGGRRARVLRVAAMRLGILSAVLLAGLAATSPVGAKTFAFDWSAPSDPANTSDATMQAVGTITLNVGAGSTFDIDDLSEIDLEVSGATIPTFFIGGGEAIRILTGIVADDGQSLRFTDFFFGSKGGLSFGCDFRLCGQGPDAREDYNIVSGLAFENVSRYLAPVRALGSLTAAVFVDPDPVDPDPIDPGTGGPGTGDPVSPIPLPASAPLLLGGLAALALWRRRKAA